MSEAYSQALYYSNVVELGDLTGRILPKPTCKVEGKMLYAAFQGGHAGDPIIEDDLDHAGHPDEDRLRDRLEHVTKLGVRLSLREQRLVHRMLVPVMEVGRATDRDQLVRSLIEANFDHQKRRAIFGPEAKALRAWLNHRAVAVWEFEGQAGNPPTWLASLCEILAQEALRPDEVGLLTPPDFFYVWEREAKKKYY